MDPSPEKLIKWLFLLQRCVPALMFAVHFRPWCVCGLHHFRYQPRVTWAKQARKLISLHIWLKKDYLSSRADQKVLAQQPFFVSGQHLPLHGDLHHIIFHVLQDLRYADLLTTLLVINLWACGIALWPQATVDYMLGAAGAPVAVDVGVTLQVLVPAVQGCRQGSAFDLDVYPGAADQGQGSNKIR